MSRKEFRDLAAPEEARAIIDDLDLRPEPETVALSEARGRVTAERIDATLDVPGFDRAAMDGYAVRAADTFGADETDPAVLEAIGAIRAGESPDVTVEGGCAVEISTGAVLPPGADAVVMVERTTETDGEVRVRTAVAPGDHVMVAGADIAAGSRALGPGTHITARDVGLLSALGMTDVPVVGQPTVGIISTGDELVPPGDPLDSDRGEIYDVNGHTLATAVTEAGGDPVRYPTPGDDVEALEATLGTAAAECDLVLSSGSTSAGAADVIYRIVEERGELLLHGVAVKPGKPTLLGRIDNVPYIGLPGYPVSALTIFRTFVAPAIRSAAELPDPQTASMTGTLATRVQYTEGRRRFLPVGLIETATEERLVYPVDKGSGATTSLVEADGIVEMSASTERLEQGDRVIVQLFSPDVRPPTLLGVGEDGPGVSSVLDRLDRPRYLPVGSIEGARRLRGGVPDVAVLAGPVESPDDAERLGGWRRAWGLIVAPDNARGIEGLADLVDGDHRFVNRDADSGLRATLDSSLDALAMDRGVTRGDLTATIDGYAMTTKAHESPARRVRAGQADVGLGLRATATALDLGFVALGEQRVDVVANPDRRGKATVGRLAAVLDETGDRPPDGRTP